MAVNIALMGKSQEKFPDRLSSPIEQIAYECADKLIALDPQARAESVQLLMRRLAEIHNTEQAGLEMEQEGLNNKLSWYHRTNYYAAGLEEQKENRPSVARSTY